MFSDPWIVNYRIFERADFIHNTTQHHYKLYLSVIVYTAHPETVAVPAVDDGNDDHMWEAEENI